MRLIDADKLPWVDRVILVDQVDGDINITIAKEHTSYVNDETPTVKAIPIEWILNKYRGKWEKAEMGRRDFQFIEVIDELLADSIWKKENQSLE